MTVRIGALHIPKRRTRLLNHPSAVEIAARHQLKPFDQGDLDGLCGLYATIHALRLALVDRFPLTKARCKELFAEGVQFLDGKRGFATAAISGMGTQRRVALARHLAKQVSATNCQVVIERPDHSAWTSIDQVFGWIEESLSEGKPVLVALMGGLDHYTVIAGSTAGTLQFFDSAGHRFLRKSSCGLRSGFHQIPSNGLLRVAVQRAG